MYAFVAFMLAAPSIRLVVWPAGERIWQGHAVYTGVKVIVNDPEGAIPCPEIRVDWGDGSRSSVQSIGIGCDPFSQPGGRYTFFPKLHPYRDASPCSGYSVEACVVDVRGECKPDLTMARRVRIYRPGECASEKIAGVTQ